MLILTRRLDEALTIGDEIVVRVTSIEGQQVRLGIETPPAIAVHREEIYERLLAERSETDCPPSVGQKALASN